MLNNVILLGRLTADPELKEIGKEGKVVNFTLAVGRKFKNAEGEYDTDFIQCNIWNKLAENMSEYCHKGDLIAVEGALQTSTYEDKEGQKRYKTEVRVDNVTFVSTKKVDVKDGE